MDKFKVNALSCYLSLILLIGGMIAGFSQQKTVEGKVTDENGLPLPGATVIEQGTDNGATTDFEGNYLILVSEDSSLEFSFVGYQSQVIAVGDQDKINMILRPDSELDEIIVIGYGTTTKKSFVGTATKIDGENMESKNTTNISQALAGEVAGVTVINSSGQPGSTSTVRIRGFGSMIGNRDPLYVVDGIPFSGNINSINKADIESYTVLKDASATAIYGSHGANGVVLITTKKGKAGKSQIEVTINQGTNRRALPKYETITDQEQYVELGWESLKNYAIIKEIDNPEGYANTNLFGGKGISTHYNMWDKPGNELIDPATGKFRSGVKRKYTPEKWNDYL